MSDSLPQPEPDNVDASSAVPAQNVPNAPNDEIIDAAEAEEIEVPDDPEAMAADRAGFKFLAIGFLIFFIIIAVCAGIVALKMKSMGI